MADKGYENTEQPISICGGRCRLSLRKQMLIQIFEIFGFNFEVVCFERKCQRYCEIKNVSATRIEIVYCEIVLIYLILSSKHYVNQNLKMFVENNQKMFATLSTY